MPECDVCHSKQFEVHDGYYYCVECQTQSQGIQEQVYEYRAGDVTLKEKKSGKSRKTKKTANSYEDGAIWTSWEAFNYVLYGMTKELMKIGVAESFEDNVLKLWSCYLSHHQVAFTSKHSELQPRLGFPYKARDGKLLYNVDAINYRYFKMDGRKRKRRKSGGSSASDLSLLAVRTLKKRVATSDYESHLSSSQLTNNSSSIMDETLESIGTSGESVSSNEPEKRKLPRSKCMTPDGFYAYKNYVRSPKSNKHFIKCNANSVCKATLLGIITLALLISKCDITLSDILRFIAEGSLSYCSVSHFLPDDFKFAPCEQNGYNTIADKFMPTHKEALWQAASIGRRLKVLKIPAPDFEALLKRYGYDLQLPDQFTELAIRLLRFTQPLKVWVTSKNKHVHCFEAMALAPLLVLFKLLLGMDSCTEYLASHFADIVNSIGTEARNLFSFSEWRKMIECRNAVLVKFHYPTREQLNPNIIIDANGTVHFLKGIIKDEHLRSRLKKTRESSFHLDLDEEISKSLETLRVTNCDDNMYPKFRSTLCPGISLIEDIIQYHKDIGVAIPGWSEYIGQDWHSCDISYLLEPNKFYRLLSDNGVKIIDYNSKDWISQHMKELQVQEIDVFDTLTQNESEDVLFKAKKAESNKCLKVKMKFVNDTNDRCRPRDHEDEVRVRTDHAYWRLNQEPKKPEWTISEFDEKIMPQFAPSWQWLLTHCSRSFRISARTLYTHVVQFEKKLIMYKTASVVEW